MNPNITPIEPRQDAAAEIERLRGVLAEAVYLLKRAQVDMRKGTLLSATLSNWLADAADTIGGDA
jgi:hypothetical protein